MPITRSQGGENSASGCTEIRLPDGHSRNATIKREERARERARELLQAQTELADLLIALDRERNKLRVAQGLKEISYRRRTGLDGGGNEYDMGAPNERMCGPPNAPEMGKTLDVFPGTMYNSHAVMNHQYVPALMDTGSKQNIANHDPVRASKYSGDNREVITDTGQHVRLPVANIPVTDISEERVITQVPLADRPKSERPQMEEDLQNPNEGESAFPREGALGTGELLPAGHGENEPVVLIGGGRPAPNESEMPITRAGAPQDDEREGPNDFLAVKLIDQGAPEGQLSWETLLERSWSEKTSVIEEKDPITEKNGRIIERGPSVERGAFMEKRDVVETKNSVTENGPLIEKNRPIMEKDPFIETEKSSVVEKKGRRKKKKGASFERGPVIEKGPRKKKNGHISERCPVFERKAGPAIKKGQVMEQRGPIIEKGPLKKKNGVNIERGPVIEKSKGQIIKKGLVIERRGPDRGRKTPAIEMRCSFTGKRCPVIQEENPLIERTPYTETNPLMERKFSVRKKTSRGHRKKPAHGSPIWDDGNGWVRKRARKGGGPFLKTDFQGVASRGQT